MLYTIKSFEKSIKKQYNIPLLLLIDLIVYAPATLVGAYCFVLSVSVSETLTVIALNIGIVSDRDVILYIHIP